MIDFTLKAANIIFLVLILLNKLFDECTKDSTEVKQFETNNLKNMRLLTLIVRCLGEKLCYNIL